MTIRIYPEEKRGFANADFEPLKEHYNEKNFQIHVIHEYAKLGLKKLSEALSFVLAYFSRCPSSNSSAAICRAQGNSRTRHHRGILAADCRKPAPPPAAALVAEKPDTNRLILAGPGSGKTRVIVHRVAYLVRVLREPPGSIIVLAFNRGAAWEIRQRLRQLIGNEALGVTVLTYHALALRLTGSSLAALTEQQR
jgi:ATP-dependent DNA helicase RecQ